MSAAKHYIWSAIGQFGTEILGFTGNVLLARILVPEDYGLVAMVAIVVELSMRLTDAGFNDGLIRKSNSDKYDFGTIATYNISISVLLFLIIHIAAPYIASFFNKPILTDIVRVLSLAIIVKSITINGFVQLTKNLEFKQITKINILCSVCSISLVYAMAVLGCSFWALVAQPIITSTLNLVFLLCFTKWRPYFCFRWDRFKEMFGFSSNLLLSYIINTIGTNVYSIIIGKYYSVSNLGFYNQALKMQTIPTQGLNSVILSTSYPIIAKEVDSQKRYELYVSLFKKFNFIMSAFVFLMISMSDIVFVLLFGDKWLPSSPLFQLLILMSLLVPIVTINSNIIKVQGLSTVYRNLSFVRNGLKVLALCACVSFSLEIIIVGQVVASFMSAAIDMYYCGRSIGFTIGIQCPMWLKIVWKPLLAIVLGKFLSFISVNFIISNIIWCIGFLFIFLATCEITKDEVYNILKKRIIRTIWKKK